MITFPSSLGISPANFIQGPTRAWYAPYVSGGGDAATGAIVSLGALDKNGFEFDHKQTYSEPEIDQSTTPPDAFLTKQEFDFKITFLELSPANLVLMLGLKAPALSVSGGVATLSLGEPFDIPAGMVPTMRPDFRQLLLQFPSSGHDNTTSPAGAWGYFKLYKTYAKAHGAVKFNKDATSNVQVTMGCLADFTVSGPYKVGVQIQQ